MKKRTIFIIAAVIATLFIFENSLQSGDVSSKSSNAIADAVRKGWEFLGFTINRKTMNQFVRKTAHVLEFGLQGLFLTGCYSGKFSQRIIYVFFFGLMTACVDEFIQVFSDGRASMIQDVFLDFIGTAVGLLVYWFLHNLKRKKLRKDYN